MRLDAFGHRHGYTPKWLCQFSDMSHGVPVDSFGFPDDPRKERMATRTTQMLWRILGDNTLGKGKT